MNRGWVAINILTLMNHHIFKMWKVNPMNPPNGTWIFPLMRWNCRSLKSTWRPRNIHIFRRNIKSLLFWYRDGEINTEKTKTDSKRKSNILCQKQNVMKSYPSSKKENLSRTFLNKLTLIALKFSYFCAIRIILKMITCSTLSLYSFKGKQWSTCYHF